MKKEPTPHEAVSRQKVHEKATFPKKLNYEKEEKTNRYRYDVCKKCDKATAKKTNCRPLSPRIEG